MNVLPFPTRRPDGAALQAIDALRKQLPEHRVWWFNALSDADQFKLARHFLRDTSPEPRPAWAAYEADAAQG